VNDVAELKEYVRVHARGQGVGEYRAVLREIRSDQACVPGSWVAQWCQAAQRQEARGRDLHAARRYALAAFPFIDGPARLEAHERCVAALGRWAGQQRDVEPVEVKLDDGVVRCWGSGLGQRRPRPLVLVMGGIVTVKEQWAAVLPGLRRLGLAAVVTELPSVGENQIRYGPGSERMLSGLLDALDGRADVSRTHLIALSFSGHLALRCAAADRRIATVITAGAPVGPFFTDQAWHRQLPGITLDTLAHLTGTGRDEVAAGLRGWALTPAELRALDIDVFYAASRRDDIIPPGDTRMLRENLSRLHLIEHDDLHGSPRHVRETQLWTLASLLRSCGGRTVQAAACHGLMRLEQARRRLT
jgi:hypothetical protein